MSTIVRIVEFFRFCPDRDLVAQKLLELAFAVTITLTATFEVLLACQAQGFIR